MELFAAKFGEESSDLLAKAEDLRTFLAGRGIRYDDPFLTPRPVKKVGIFQPGECLPDITVTLHATGRAVSLHSALRADGSWHLIVFGGDVSHHSQMQRVHSLAKDLETLWETHAGRDKSRLDAIVVHCAPWTDVELADFPTLFFPPHATTGRDYRRIYIDETGMYSQARLDRGQGGLVLARPDRHVAWTGGMEHLQSLEASLCGIFSKKGCRSYADEVATCGI